MKARRFWQRLFSAFAIIAILGGGSPANAGTTGQLLGIVTDTTGAPIVAAKVTAASPSGIVVATTDATGHFAMLDLLPDTYVVSFETAAYQSAVISRVTITADGSRSIDEVLSKLSTSVANTAHAASSVLRANSGSTAYSVDAVTQFKTSLAGGAGFSNSAYSALSTVPGVFVAPDQNGYGPDISIRGGGADEVGYEIEGVPVNRPFDNAPGGPASSLGQQELQVYTGSAPADSAGQGLSGVVNQVIRVGTSPGFTSLEGSLGGASFYHQLQFETGGTTTNRNFSYYVAIGGFDQAFRYADNFGGRGLSQSYGVPLADCSALGVAAAPSCYARGVYVGTGVNSYATFFGFQNPGYALGPANLFSTSQVDDRSNLVNLHLTIPRKNGRSDDVSFFGDVDFVKTYFDSSQDDFGDANLLRASGSPVGLEYVDGLQFNAPTGIFLPTNYKHLTTPYFFPFSPTNRALYSTIPLGLEDNETNNQAITKIQYTHPFSDNALLRVYGFTDYVDQAQDAADEDNYYIYEPLTAGESLSNHSRGFGASFVDQIGTQNQLQIGTTFTTSTTYEQFSFEPGDAGSTFAYVVDSTNPTSGLCYPVTGGSAVSCSSPQAGVATFQQAYQGKITPASGTCGGGPCRYLVTDNGTSGPVNTVTPTNTAASIVDLFRPTQRLSLEGGLRIDNYRDEGAQTNTGNTAQAFLYNAFNIDNCIDPHYNEVPRAPNAQCPAGTTPADLQNPTGRFTQNHLEFEPRLRASFTAGADTVLRAGYARVSQAQPVQEIQFASADPATPYLANKPDGLLFYGINTQNHVLPPTTSNTYDVSIEHTFGRDAMFRLTPFYRTTQNQLLGMYPVTYINVPSYSDIAQQTSRGVELEIDEGRFDRDGIAARLTATYTNSFVHYLAYNPHGDSVVDPINANIAQYNAYTSACAPGGKLAGKSQYGTPVCGSTETGAAASPCYSPSAIASDGMTPIFGVAEACSVAGAVGNPYWNAPALGLIDPRGDFPTIQTVGVYPGFDSRAYDAPYVASLTLNYKRGPFAITPLLTLEAGQRYGEPGTTYGVGPDLCSGLTNAVPNDPRYPYGSPGGVGFDVTSPAGPYCSSGLEIPNPYTRKFDAFGAFAEPSVAQAQIQMTYDVSKNFQVALGLANVLTECFGGSKEPWNVGGACSYTPRFGASIGAGDVGNQYNPGAVIQPYLNTPYLPNFAPAPFGFGLSVKIKL